MKSKQYTKIFTCEKCKYTSNRISMDDNKNETIKCKMCGANMRCDKVINYRPDMALKNLNKKSQEQKTNQNIPKCPTCGSSNIKKISTASKIAGATMFGLFSRTAKSQFKCENCGYKW